jgi:hypothetical protein
MGLLSFSRYPKALRTGKSSVPWKERVRSLRQRFYGKGGGEPAGRERANNRKNMSKAGCFASSPSIFVRAGWVRLRLLI